MREFVVLLVACLVIACSDSEDATPTEEALSGDDQAHSLLLTVDDFPSGWSEAPSDGENAFPKCGEAFSSDGIVGSARSSEFSDGGSADVEEWIAIFGDADAAADAIRPEGALQCRVDELNEGGGDTDEIELSDARYEPLQFPTFGDKSEAFRLTVHAKRKSGFGDEANGYLDVIVVATGDKVVQVVATNVLSPFDTGELEDIVEAAVTKAE